MRKTLLTLLIAASAFAFAQDQTTTPPIDSDVTTQQGMVTIASKGADVRNVLFDLFTQSKKNFVLEPNVHFVLYLSLAGVEFEEALNIVTNLADLEYEIDNGIYFIGKKKVGSTPQPKPEITKPKAPPAKRGKLTPAELNKHLTTRFSKTGITEVFKSFSDQTGIEIIIDPDVPLYKLDAYLIDTSLQYALDVIAKSANLKYTLTDDKQIRISKK
ncbi:MAG TPA: hypothetical protein VNI20_01045 [Fimbriimonadaceae bacterium]|nr:hypothetical protein [Fimbriimonadaceae bacterium]